MGRLYSKNLNCTTYLLKFTSLPYHLIRHNDVKYFDCLSALGTYEFATNSKTIKPLLNQKLQDTKDRYSTSDAEVPKQTLNQSQLALMVVQ